jgi:hypothetical protein
MMRLFMVEMGNNRKLQIGGTGTIFDIHLNFIHTALLAGSVVLLATGCATEPAANLQRLTADAGPQRLEIDGLIVTVRPITDVAEVKKTLGVNLLAEGVLPIKLQAENRNATASYIIAKEKVLVMKETAGTTNSSPQAVVARDLSRDSHARQMGDALILEARVPVLGNLPLLMTVLSPAPADTIDRGREYKLASREFYTRTLGPGQRAEGIIFYRCPDSIDPAGAYHVVAQIKNTATDAVIPFDFTVNLNLKEP